jgi:hypothetical protein
MDEAATSLHVHEMSRQPKANGGILAGRITVALRAETKQAPQLLAGLELVNVPLIGLEPITH